MREGKRKVIFFMTLMNGLILILTEMVWMKAREIVMHVPILAWMII
jgi:hypothetical protein